MFTEEPNVQQHVREQVREYFTKSSQVLVAYLFGSQVAGDTGPMSDYDFGLQVESPSAELRSRLQHDLALIVDDKHVDVVFLDEAPIELAYAIVAEGQLPYECDRATRVDVEAYIVRRYCDYLPVLRRQGRTIREGGRRDTGTERYREALRRTERTLAALRITTGEAS